MSCFVKEICILHSCSYCKRPAKVRFKTGKRSWCCEDNIAKCPAIRARNSRTAKKLVGWKHSKATRQKMSEAQKGRIITDEHRKRLSESHLGMKHTEKAKATMRGRIPWNKGKTDVYSDETRNQISNSLKGNIPWNKGKPRSKKTRKKISLSHVGKVLSIEHRQAIGDAHKGQKRSIETRLKMSQVAAGKNSSQWKGGIAKEPYSQEWTVELKERIKKRDNHCCQNPDCWQSNTRLTVHHIDYNKKNCNLRNLITLCASCNSRANADRGFWRKHYKQIVNE